MKDYESIKKILVGFLKDYITKKSKAKNLLIGVSGGIDSAVVATLCAAAMPKNTHALIMPTNASSTKNIDDALNLCKKLGLNFKILNIQAILDAFGDSIGENIDKLRKGNLSARVRMSLLYDYSASINALVVGTSNKSELMLGYGTIFGDLACAINPIGELYKTEIFEFAKYLGVDENIINKAPSADLWEGQSDENDIGYTYETIDEILKGIAGGNLGASVDKFGQDTVDEIVKRVESNKFKRQMPLIAKI